MWLQNANAAGIAMSWDNAKAWANSLVYSGYDDWRLPSVPREYGGHCEGMNCTLSEMGHLYYREGVKSVSQLPFVNIKKLYWSGTFYATYDISYAVDFNFSNGYQDISHIVYGRYSWAVRDEASHPYDTNQDWIIGDFELLRAIDYWASGLLGDFELLNLIDFWAAGCYLWDAISGSYGVCSNRASGTYIYDAQTRELNLNLTSSDFTNCGPGVETLLFNVQSITYATLVWIDSNSSNQTILTRESGQIGDLVGVWTIQDNDGNVWSVIFDSDGSVIILANIVNCYTPPNEPFVPQNKIITIDGNYSDWASSDRIYLDTYGPDCDAAGQDIKEVYIAQDSDFIYLRFILGGPLDETFGYRFGDDDRHISVGQNSGGGYIDYGNCCEVPQPNLPDDFVHIDGNQFEGRFYKSDVKESWENIDFAAWSDQGHETICTDYIPLQTIVFDWIN